MFTLPGYKVVLTAITLPTSPILLSVGSVSSHQTPLGIWGILLIILICIGFLCVSKWPSISRWWKREQWWGRFVVVITIISVLGVIASALGILGAILVTLLCAGFFYVSIWPGISWWWEREQWWGRFVVVIAVISLLGLIALGISQDNSKGFFDALQPGHDESLTPSCRLLVRFVYSIWGLVLAVSPLKGTVTDIVLTRDGKSVGSYSVDSSRETAESNGFLYLVGLFGIGMICYGLWGIAEILFV